LAAGHDDGETAIGSLVVGATLAAVRAATVKLWSQDGQILRQGTWLTATLWVVAVVLTPWPTG
jgi:hypothetical protein